MSGLLGVDTTKKPTLEEALKRIGDLEIAICEFLVSDSDAEILKCIVQFRILMRPENRT